MKKKLTTRILCKAEGKYHTVTFHPDGTSVSTGCGDVTDTAKGIAAMAALGKAIPADHCAGLVAFTRHGIAALFRQPAEEGDDLQLGVWRDLYQRFANNKIVEATFRRERRIARKRDRELAASVAAAE